MERNGSTNSRSIQRYSPPIFNRRGNLNQPASTQHWAFEQWYDTPTTMMTTTTTTTTVLFPTHCSYHTKTLPQPNNNHKRTKDDCKKVSSTTAVVLLLQCHADGVCWRGLYPLLMMAKRRTAKTALAVILSLLQTNKRTTGHQQQQIDGLLANNMTLLLSSAFSSRRINRLHKNNNNYLVVVIPPDWTRLNGMFGSLLIRWEHLWIQARSWTAWISTLGGGYFLCRHLETAIWLARQQRWLALWMGNTDMADRCTLNEAFNYIHAGQFHTALRMVRRVQQGLSPTNNNQKKRRRETPQTQQTLRMCDAAILFLQRVRRAAKHQNHDTHQTMDDYQRIRIVKVSSSRH